MARAVRRFGFVVGVLLVAFAATVRLARPGGPSERAAAGVATPSVRPSPPPPGPGRPALVFFVDPAGAGLVAHRTRVLPFADVSLQAKAILDAVIAGPGGLPAPGPGDAPIAALPAVPPGVSARAVFFDGKGTAVVDLAGLPGALPGGTDAEVFALWSIVDALAFNFPVDARRVRILLDGREADSLGHVSLASPLSPRRDLVLGEIPSLATSLAGGRSAAPVPDVEVDGPSPFDDL